MVYNAAHKFVQWGHSDMVSTAVEAGNYIFKQYQFNVNEWLGEHGGWVRELKGVLQFHVDLN